MTTAVAPRGGLAPGRTAFLFDLDGTLVDSVYQHVLAWRKALADVRRSHRRVENSSAHRHERGTHGKRHFAQTGYALSAEQAARLLRVHAEAYARLARRHPTSARCARVAGLLVEERRALGRRDKRTT